MIFEIREKLATYRKSGYKVEFTITDGEDGWDVWLIAEHPDGEDLPIIEYGNDIDLLDWLSGFDSDEQQPVHDTL